MTEPHPDYWLSDNPPPGAIPVVRRQMIAFAKANQGKWIQYRPHPDRDRIKLQSLRNVAIKGNTSGFQGGRWTASISDDCVHLCYLGPKS